MNRDTSLDMIASRKKEGRRKWQVCHDKSDKEKNSESDARARILGAEEYLRERWA